MCCLRMPPYSKTFPYSAFLVNVNFNNLAADMCQFANPMKLFIFVKRAFYSMKRYQTNHYGRKNNC